jgi:hypothetical protein
MEAIAVLHPGSKTRTIRELAREALQVQDACNLSGVVHAFARAMSDLLKHPECTGTDWANTHPVAVLYADKIAHLTGTQSLDTEKIWDAYRFAQELIKEDS